MPKICHEAFQDLPSPKACLVLYGRSSQKWRHWWHSVWHWHASSSADDRLIELGHVFLQLLRWGEHERSSEVESCWELIYCLVLSNMVFIFHFIYGIVIPTDSYFSEARSSTKQFGDDPRDHFTWYDVLETSQKWYQSTGPRWPQDAPLSSKQRITWDVPSGND